LYEVFDIVVVSTHSTLFRQQDLKMPLKTAGSEYFQQSGRGNNQKEAGRVLECGDTSPLFKAAL